MTDRHEHLPKLTPEDERVFTRLAEVGFEIDALDLTDDDRQRAERLLDLLGLLNDYPVEDALEEDQHSVLADATLARIDRYEDRRVERMTVAAGTAGGRRPRLPDFITVAAVILIGASIALPLLQDLRQKSIDRECMNNLRLVGYGLSQYAADHGGEVPMAHAGASTWSLNDMKYSMNLGPLVEGDYCKHGCLKCPGHHNENEISYSYQWQPEGVRPRWGTDQGVTILLGDLNPVIDAIRTGRQMPPSASSHSHAGRGQNMLRSDGATMWSTEPNLGRDFIWVPEDGLHEGARPRDHRDVFLAD